MQRDVPSGWEETLRQKLEEEEAQLRLVTGGGGTCNVRRMMMGSSELVVRSLLQVHTEEHVYRRLRDARAASLRNSFLIFKLLRREILSFVREKYE